MLTEPGGPFLDVSKLDLNKYAQKPALARVLFEYLYYHENDTKNSLELAAISTAAAGYQDWWQDELCWHCGGSAGSLPPW